MQTKKGFTLIELLAVIVILGVLLSLSVIAVNSQRKQQDKENLQNTISSILTGAKMYVSDNRHILDEELSSIHINVGTLISGNYVEFDTSDESLSGLVNEKVEISKCDDNDNMKLKYYITFDGNTYNDCGCESQQTNVEAQKICTG